MTMKIIYIVLFGFIASSAFGQNDIIIPVLYMPFVNTQTFRFWLEQTSVRELSRKFTAIHLVEKEPQHYNIEKLYSQSIFEVASNIQSDYLAARPPPPPSSISNIDYYWSTNISRDDIKGTELEGVDLIYFTFGNVQEMMLKNISKKMSIELSQVAVRLGVPTRNLSYAYEPTKWDVLVHAMVAEGILNYKSLLQLGSEDKVAALVSLSLIQLKNVTIDGFLSLLPPFLPKKSLLDQNKTSDILVSTGLSVGSTEALLYKMVNLTTQLTVEQFGILYNLTTGQQRATERSTLLQISQVCDISMSLLLDKTIPNVVWDALGNIANPAPCSVMLIVKGRPISSFGFTNPQRLTVLQILLGICNQYWRSCRLTMTLEPSEWECLDSVSLSQAATILSTTESSLLDSPVHDLVSAMLGECYNRSHDLESYRQNTSNALQTLFNLTASQLQTLLGITSQTYASFNSAQMVEAFLNGSSIDLGIPLSTMFNTSTKTIQELYSSPISELQEIIPFILRSAIKSPASQLRMSDADTFILLGLFPDNSTIAELKFAVTYILPAILLSKRKFDNETLSVYLRANQSITDDVFGANSTLAVLLAASGFDIKTLKIIHGLTDQQLTVLSLSMIKDLQRYCGLDLSVLKQLSPYNVTAALVGIQNLNATCKATGFFVEARSKNVADHEATCSALSNTSMSLLRVAEACSGLHWRFIVKMLGVSMSDWPQMDALNKGNMPALSRLSVDTVQHKTLEYLLKKANEIHAANSAGYRTVLEPYSTQILNVLLTTFSTSISEVSQTTGITESSFDSMNILLKSEQVQEFLKRKYSITFASIVTVLDILLSDIKYLAPTEWQEMLHPLKKEIVASGSLQQLNIMPNSFTSLLQLSSNVSYFTLAQLEAAWDRDFGRLLNGKTFSENKTLSAIQLLMGISQGSLNGMTLLTLFKAHLNLTKQELPVLFVVDAQAVDVLNEFYFQEIPCSCGFSEADLQSKTPYQLLLAMIGHTDVSSCRNIAFLVAFRLLTISQLFKKFNVTVNDSIPLLDNIQSFSDLPFEKLAWGLKAKGSDWPVLVAVSLNDLANVTSNSVLAITNRSMANVTDEIVMRKGEFSLQLGKLHDDLVAQASSLFALTASETCGQCSQIPNTEILKTFLSHLGGLIHFDPQNLPFVAGFECIKHDNMLLPPSKWSMLIPFIIPKSFSNISSLLGITEEQLADIYGQAKGEIMNMTLKEYIDITKVRIHPLFTCREVIKNDIVLTKVSSQGVSVSTMGKQNVLQFLMLMCNNVSVSNMSLVMGWSPENTTVLGNYTMEDAALCKRMPVKDVVSRTLMALVEMVLNEVHECVIIPCRSGTVLDYQTYTCTDVNECNATEAPKCQNDQICQNYFGGYECQCVKAGTSLEGQLCDRTKHYLIKITIVNVVFTESLKMTYSREYYNLKEKLQININKVFLDAVSFKIHYKGCRVRSFSSGSVVADVSVYTSPQYTGTLADLEDYFKLGLNNTNGKTYLGDLEIKSDAAKVSDFDECSSNANDCSEESTCMNEEGSFSCKCKSGYDGDGVTCKATFLATYWWLVILFAIILLILIILIIVLVVKRPKLSTSYGVGDEIAHTEIARSGSNVSYKNGDVFYKDKEGNVIPGTKHAPEHQNPLYGSQIPENVYESSWSNNVLAMDNLGAEKPAETKTNAPAADHVL